MTPKYKALDIANYFLSKAQDDDQELISNLKLQKLVYYAQGIHLAIFKKPLFGEAIVAWNYGPVVEELYHRYKKYEAGGIPANKTFKRVSIDINTRTFLDEIYKVFGQFSAIRLMTLAHSDQCWIDAGIGNEITCNAMQKDLRKYLKDKDE